jgi:hypothetical protein
MTAAIPRPAVVSFARDEFLTGRWRYRPGEHVTILGPTGSGKTWLGYQLLGQTSRPALPAVVLVMKPRDGTVEKWTRTVGYRRVRSWPPVPTPWSQKPPGWVLWPKFVFDPELDDLNLYHEFRAAMLDCYKRGNRIVFGDEAYGLANDLRLGRELVTLWTRGRSMGCGLWASSQRPTHVPLHAYSQAEHLFLFRDPDKRAWDRYAEIGGVDPDLVRSTVIGLDKYQCLYIRRTGGRMCVVDR